MKYVDLGPEWEPWKCSICFKYWVVRSLARDCEARHEEISGKSLKSIA